MEDNKKLSMPMFRRITRIHQLIAEKKYPNCKTLSKDMECSEMTIHRDLNILTDEFGAPLDFDWTLKGYYYTQEFSIPLLETISQSEIATLKIAQKLLSIYKNIPFYNKIDSLINTLCACGNNPLNNISSGKDKENNKEFTEYNLIKRIGVPPTPSIKIEDKIWKLITLSLSENRILTFDIDNCTWDPNIGTKRTLRPYQILIENGLLYIYGYLEEKNDVRLYDLRRLYNIKVLPQHFSLPKNFEFEKVIGGGRFGVFTRYKPKTYKIAFYEDARELVRNTLWAKDQIIEEDEKGERTIITFSSSQDMKILDWVFENKAYAIPLEPPEFVEQWKYNIKVMAQIAGLIK